MAKLRERIDWLAARPGLWRRLPGLDDPVGAVDAALLRSTAQTMYKLGLFKRHTWIVARMEHIRAIVTDLRKGLYRRRA